MMSMMLRGSVLIVAALFVGCAQEEVDAGNHAAPSVGANAAPPSVGANAADKPVEMTLAEPIVLAEYRVLNVPTFEMRPAVSWTRTERGELEVFSSPDGKVRVIVAPYRDGDAIGPRREGVFDAIEATEVRPSEQREIRVGEAQLSALAQDGTLRLSTGEAGFQSAVITEQGGHKVFVAYVFTKDASDTVRADGMRMIGSLRGKS